MRNILITGSDNVGTMHPGIYLNHEGVLVFKQLVSVADCFLHLKKVELKDTPIQKFIKQSDKANMCTISGKGYANNIFTAYWFYKKVEEEIIIFVRSENEDVNKFWRSANLVMADGPTIG